VEFFVLGSVRLRIEGREVALGGPKQRALLALLLLQSNRVVARDRLIDGLWGERPPSTAEHTLDGYVSRLRKLVGSERLVRERHGYRLHVEPGELDLERFEVLAEEGSQALAAGEDLTAATKLSAALAEWVDEPLVDLLNEPFAAAAVRELNDRRVVAVEQHVEAALRLGRAADVVSDLEQLIRENPFHERFIAQLTLALHQCGRSADALAQLAATRQRFGTELGMDVSPQLHELERRILQHDPTLALPGRPTTRRRPRGRAAAAVAVAGLAAAATGVGLALDRHHGAGGDSATRSQLTAVGTRQVIDIPYASSALTTSGKALWIAQPDQSLVLRIDPTAGSVVDRVPVHGIPTAFAAADNSLWVATTQPGGVVRIDPATDTITQTVPLGINPVALAFTHGSLWVVDASDESLIKIDPRTGDALATVSLTSHPSSLVVDGTTGWVASHDDGTLTEVDLRTGTAVATATVGTGLSALTIASGAVWIANSLAGTVTRLDPTTMSVSATIATGSGPSAITSSGSSLWVANEFSQTLTRIDTRTSTVISTKRLAGAPLSLSVEGGKVWAATKPVIEHRGGRLVLLAQGPFTSMDPAIEYEVPPAQFHGLAYDTLVTFDHTGGPHGLEIVPDLAVAVPAPGDGGRSYAFRLRAGIRYSDGRLLAAGDVKRAFERLFRVRSPVADTFRAIAGTSGCSVAKCDLAPGITIDDQQRTVVFHLTRPDPEFLFKLAYVFTAPVPPGTPWTEMKTRPFPGTGPYRIAEATSREMRLVRNPFFHEWSRAAQPQGNPDEIDWRFGLSAAAEARAVAAGRADWMFDNVPGNVIAKLRRQRPSELHSNIAPETDFVQIDARRPPFHDSRVRRAFNLAIDHSRIVKLYGGAARPTCQILPPGVPGYRHYCPYRHGLAQARRLIRAAHAVGEPVSIVGFTDDPTIRRTVFIYLASLLRQIGLKPHITWTSHATFNDAQHFDLIPQGWYADYPAASDFFGVYLACDAPYNDGKFCDPKLDRQIRLASATEAVDPHRAAALWALADRRAVNDAAWAPLANPTLFDFTSARTHDYQHHVLWGFLADQVQLHGPVAAR
jgi:YVTN family beta-propeller protein